MPWLSLDKFPQDPESSVPVLMLHELNGKRDGHLFPHENSLGLEHTVPAQPKSLRLIFVETDTPTRMLFQKSFVGCVGPSTIKRTFRVVPRMVKYPSTAKVARQSDRRLFACREHV